MNLEFVSVMGDIQLNAFCGEVFRRRGAVVEVALVRGLVDMREIVSKP